MAKNNRTVDRIQAVWNILGGERGVDDLINGITCVTRKAVSYIVALFTVTVDETISVEEAVEVRRFGCSDPKITSEKFPKLANGRKSDRGVVIFYFNKKMSSKAVLTEIDKAGYKPANIWELIGLAMRGDLQIEYSIIALGSVCELDGDFRVPCLCGHGCDRGLDLLRFDRDWSDHCRFLAISK